MAEYRNGDKVEATRDVGGFLGSVSQGTEGEVIGNTMFGDHYQVKFDNGQVVEVPKEDIRRTEGGGLFD